MLCGGPVCPAFPQALPTNRSHPAAQQSRLAPGPSLADPPRHLSTKQVLEPGTWRRWLCPRPCGEVVWGGGRPLAPGWSAGSLWPSGLTSSFLGPGQTRCRWPAGENDSLSCTGYAPSEFRPVLQGDITEPCLPHGAQSLGHKDRDLATLRVLWGARPEPRQGGHQQGKLSDGPATAAAPWPRPWQVPVSQKQQVVPRGTSKVHCRPSTGWVRGPRAAVTPVVAAGMMAELCPEATGAATKGPGEGPEACTRWSHGESFRDHPSPSMQTLTIRGCGWSLHWG